MMDLELFNNQYLTVYEVARVMKVSVKTVYDWCSKGYIPCMKLGRLVRIDKNDFQTRLNELKRQSSKRMT